jgi:hypothetical protein
MKKKRTVQYTIRQVPEEVDARLRELAVKEQCSLNYAVLDVLSRASGAIGEPLIFHDLDSLAGSWVEDGAFDTAVAAFAQVDEGLWR